MKKLALVLGSLLVVGSVASAKEVIPAPAPAPEVVVKVVEKPVVVYRDREVSRKWRPNGYVSMKFKTYGEVESTGSDDKRTWGGADLNSRLELKGNVNITENQNLEIRTRDWRGWTSKNNEGIAEHEAYVEHTYDFGKVWGKTGISLASRYKYWAGGKKQEIREKVNFDLTDYFFKNDYIETTSAVLAPTFKYAWTGEHDNEDKHMEDYGLYFDYQANIIGGFEFEAEFDNLYNYRVMNNGKARNKDKKGHTGAVELTLNRPTILYKEGKHEVLFEPKLVYSTNWAYSKKTVKDDMGGTIRNSGKKEKWGGYEAKFEPILTYSYKATDYIKLHAAIAAEYVNRTQGISKSKTNRHGANRWRWQPYTELGMKVTF